MAPRCIPPLAHLSYFPAGTMLMSRPHVRLSRSISFRLHEADYARVAYQAAVIDLRVNELARMRTLKNDQQILIRQYSRHDPALVTQLIALGNNLNQMVKRFHMTGRISPHLEALCYKIEQLIDTAVEEGEGEWFQ